MIYIACFACTAILQSFAPLGLTDGWLHKVPSLLGVLLCLAGLTLDGLAVRELWRRDTAVLPTSAASALVTTGVFGYTRNPIYIGNAVALVGIAIAFRWTWLILMLPAALAAIQAKAVLAEERHLALRFAKDWHNYARSTPRWL